MITFSSIDVSVLTGFILKGFTAFNKIVKRVLDTEKVGNNCRRPEVDKLRPARAFYAARRAATRTERVHLWSLC